MLALSSMVTDIAPTDIPVLLVEEARRPGEPT